MPQHPGSPDSLANTLQFLQSQVNPGQRQIPEASPEFLASARNPNIRNFGPGQQPEFQSPIIQMLMNAPGRAAGSIADTLAGVGVSEGNVARPAGSISPESIPQGNRGAMAGIMRMLGLSNVGDPLLGREKKLEDILAQDPANQ